MGKPIPEPTRRRIIALRGEGTSQQAIASELHISKRSVENICQRWTKEGEPSMKLYKNCLGGPRRYPETMRERAIALKREHPGWGAEVVLIELCRSYADEATPPSRFPGWRTLNQWFIEAKVNTPRRRCARLAKVKVKRGVAPHDVWAIDAKEAITLADGSSSCTLNITDEGSGAVLALVHFPPPAVG
jgi:hypothetical protein